MPKVTKANRLSSNLGDDTLSGAGGADTLLGGGDDDLLSGGAGFDVLRGGSGIDTLNGDEGADTLDGGAGADVMAGGAGNDSYVVDNAGDTVVELAGGGFDQVEASVSFSLKGTEVENLTLVGTAISGVGNALDNVIRGNAEDNVLNAGPGLDTLRGGGGRDTFVFNSPPAADNVDVIQDFKPGADTLSLGSNAFLGLSPGALPAGAFYVGAAADDAGDRIIYNSATGALLFDVDGKGGEAAVRFATLEAGLALTAADFIVT